MSGRKILRKKHKNVKLEMKIKTMINRPLFQTEGGNSSFASWTVDYHPVTPRKSTGSPRSRRPKVPQKKTFS